MKTKRRASTRRTPQALTTAKGLFLKIDGCWFQVKVLAPHPDVAAKAVRLTKLSGLIYDCHRDRFGVHCTCPDGVYRGGNGGVCKHARMLIEERLL